MKFSLGSSKPISSPGRTDKFPPPLMRFLRTNIGSKSRGRTPKASPLFMRKKPSLSSETTQEPSSPKVTCIGQVRVRRSKSKSDPKKSTGSKKSTRNRCHCVRKLMFCDSIHVKLKRPKSFRPAWRDWMFFFRCTSADKVKTDSLKTDSDGVQVDRFGGIDYGDSEEEEGGGFREERIRCGDGYVSASSTPPKNAFLLTRCRSAPYRSSSLACQFWGSPAEEVGRERIEEEDRENAGTDRNETAPTLESEPIRRDSTAESRGDREEEGSLGFCKEEEEKEEGPIKEKGKEEEEEEGSVKEKGEEIQGSVNKDEVHVNVSELRKKFEDKGNKVETNSCIELRRKSGDLVKLRSVRIDDDDDCSIKPPLMMLKRCKSEPARKTGLEKFDPEIIKFWRQTRLQITTQYGTPLAVD